MGAQSAGAAPLQASLLQSLAPEVQGRVKIMLVERTNATITTARPPSEPSPPRM